MSQDSQLQEAVLAEFNWEPSLTAGHIGVTAKGGVVTLSGHVDSFAQKHAAEMAARRVSGVIGVSNQLAIKPSVNTANLSDDITHALHRSWFFNRDNVHVRAEGGKVVLTGTVHSSDERQVAGRTVWSAPGATQVENDIAVI